MTVSDWMTPDPAVVTPDVLLFQVHSLFRRRRCRHVPVVEDGRIVGVISDRDVLEVLSPFVNTMSETDRDYRTLSKTAREMMTPDPITIRSDAPVADAARRMVDDVVSSLLVVDEAGALVGILTARDLLRATADVTRASAEAA